MSRHIEVTKRFFWKEYRAQRMLWIILIAVAVLIRVMIEFNNMIFQGQSGLDPRFVGYYLLPIIYTVCCGTLLFTTETEEQTKRLLDSFGYETRSLLLAKLGWALFASCLFLVVSVLVQLTGNENSNAIFPTLETQAQLLRMIVTICLISVMVSLYFQSVFPAILTSTGLTIAYLAIRDAWMRETLNLTLSSPSTMELSGALSTRWLTAFDVTLGVILMCLIWIRTNAWIIGRFEVLTRAPRISIQVQHPRQQQGRTPRLANWSLLRKSSIGRQFWMTSWKEWQSIKILTIILLGITILKILTLAMLLIGLKPLPILSPIAILTAYLLPPYFIDFYTLERLYYALENFRTQQMDVYESIALERLMPSLMVVLTPIVLLAFYCGIQFASDDYKSKSLQLQTSFGANSIPVYFAKLFTYALPLLILVIAQLAYNLYLYFGSISTSLSPNHLFQTSNSNSYFGYDEFNKWQLIWNLNSPARLIFSENMNDFFLKILFMLLLIYIVSILISVSFQKSMLRYFTGLLATAAAVAYSFFCMMVSVPTSFTHLPLIIVALVAAWRIFDHQLNERAMIRKLTWQIATPVTMILLAYFSVSLSRAFALPFIRIPDAQFLSSFPQDQNLRSAWLDLEHEVMKLSQKQSTDPDDALKAATKLSHLLISSKTLIDPESLGVREPLKIVQWLSEVSKQHLKSDLSPDSVQSADSTAETDTTTPQNSIFEQKVVDEELLSEAEVNALWKVLKPAIVISDNLSNFTLFEIKGESGFYGRAQQTIREVQIGLLSQKACPREIYLEFLSLPYSADRTPSRAMSRLIKQQAAINGDWQPYPLDVMTRSQLSGLSPLALEGWTSPFFFGEKIRASRIANLDFMKYIIRESRDVYQSEVLQAQDPENFNGGVGLGDSYRNSSPVFQKNKLLIFAALQAYRLEQGKLPEQLTDILPLLPSNFIEHDLSDFLYSATGADLPILISDNPVTQVLPAYTPYLFGKGKMITNMLVLSDKQRMLIEDNGISLLTLIRTDESPRAIRNRVIVNGVLRPEHEHRQLAPMTEVIEEKFSGEHVYKNVVSSERGIQTDFYELRRFTDSGYRRKTSGRQQTSASRPGSYQSVIAPRSDSEKLIKELPQSTLFIK